MATLHEIMRHGSHNADDDFSAFAVGLRLRQGLLVNFNVGISLIVVLWWRNPIIP